VERIAVVMLVVPYHQPISFAGSVSGYDGTNQESGLIQEIDASEFAKFQGQPHASVKEQLQKLHPGFFS
jgi:hypothetical protein